MLTSVERYFLTAVAVVTLVSIAVLSHAQTLPTAVDMSKAKFSWAWTQGTGGMVEKWIIRCGTATGNYTLLKELVDPAARQMALGQIIVAEGSYFCVMQAANFAGASASTAEVSFRAGKVPAQATGFVVSPQ